MHSKYSNSRFKKIKKNISLCKRVQVNFSTRGIASLYQENMILLVEFQDYGVQSKFKRRQIASLSKYVTSLPQQHHDYLSHPPHPLKRLLPYFIDHAAEHGRAICCVTWSTHRDLLLKGIFFGKKLRENCTCNPLICT